MNQSMKPADEHRALQLRIQAQALLEQAYAIDGLKPFSVTHHHRHGSSTYLLWADQAPDDHLAAELLGADFEPEVRESMEIVEGFTLKDLCGTAVASRFECLHDSDEVQQAPVTPRG